MPNPRLDQFATDTHQEVLQRAGEKPLPEFREECFFEYVTELLEEHNEVSGVDLLRPPYRAKSVGSVPAAKLNGWSQSGDGATLDLFVVHYGGSGNVVEMGLPEIRKHFTLLRGFLRRAIDGFHTKMEESSEAFRVSQKIHETREVLATVRLFFITDAVARSLNLEEKDFPGLEVRYVLWDLDKLSQLQVGKREVIQLDLVNDYEGAIPCLQTADATGEYRTFLAFIPAPLLARIYGQYGQRLLERNVRAFLQSKGGVNRGLRRTLKEEPHRFLAYNNGLCCTAAEVRVSAARDGHARLEWLRDFQIVNGGQTTASIYQAMKKDDVDIKKVVVQVKLTVLGDQTKVSEIVPLISQYANSQNKVNTADFFANGKYHHALEQLSRDVWAPATTGLERGTHWYYERARGSYADDKASRTALAKRRDWETQNPPHQKFTKTDLAKFEHSWMGLPYLVCQGAEKNFKAFAETMVEDGEPVVDQDYFKHVVAKAILFRTAEKLFDGLDLDGYRANSVAYAVAWLAEQADRRIDLRRIWEEQRLTPALCDALKIVCAAAHEHIEKQPGNINESSKKEPCWKEFKAMALDVGDGWRTGLAETPFETHRTEEEALSAEWNRVRHVLIPDSRTIGELEAFTGKVWMPTRNGDPVCFYAEKTWDQLRTEKLKKSQRMGLTTIRGLVELFSAAYDIR